MTQAEVAKLLAKCAAYDQRTVGEADVLAWHEILARVDLADAFEAVRRHYAASRERVMPADVLKLARAVREDRSRAKAEPLALPSRFETDVARDVRLGRGLSECHEVLGPIMERLAAERDKDNPAPTGSELIRRRAIERAQREKRQLRPIEDKG